MGRIRDFFNRIFRRKETKLLEPTTQKEIKKFMDDIQKNYDEQVRESLNADGKKATQEYYRRAVGIVNNFISLINDGKVDIGGDPVENPYKRLLGYFATESIVRRTIMQIVNKNFYDAIDRASNGESYDKVHSALDRTLANYLRVTGSDKKLEDIFEIGKVKQIQEIIDKNVLLVDNVMDLMILRDKIFKIYEGHLLHKIEKETDISTQISLYDEYIRDFRDGKEINVYEEREYLSRTVLDICEMEFMQVRETRKACEKYKIPEVAKVSKIYKTEKFKTTRDKNERLCEKHIKAGEVKASDLVLVRTTAMFPHQGIIEITDKHSDLLKEDTPFEDELKELGIEDISKYKLLKFQSRRTVHFTLNGLVGSHEYGNFENRDYIIIEPLDEHLEDDSLLNINEADTYFEDDLVLSKKATILIPVERYKELIKDEKTLKELNKFDIRLFDGNEEEAVRMCLLDKGYAFGTICKWGFDNYGDYSARAANENLIEACEKKIVEELQAKGKNVTYGGVHFYSETKKVDDKRRNELAYDQYKLLVECIASTCDFEFCKTALMNELLSREYLPKTAKFEDGDLDKPQLEVKEILEKLTPEGLEKATQKYNETITKEHEQARKEKDEQLKQKGLIESTKVETKEERE